MCEVRLRAQDFSGGWGYYMQVPGRMEKLSERPLEVPPVSGAHQFTSVVAEVENLEDGFHLF